MSDFVRIDTSQLKDLAFVLKRTQPAILKELNSAFGGIGQIVAERAKQNASFSSRIPGTIVSRRRALSVSVQAGGPSAPHAAVYESGGRHPLFGNRNYWYSVDAVHYLSGAAEEESPVIEAMVVTAVDHAFGEAGF